MPRSLGNPDRDFSANSSVNDMIKNLFVSPPLGLNKLFDDLFDDPIVRKRIAEMISLAMRRPPRRSSPDELF